MKLYDLGLVILISVGICFFIGIASTYYFGNDNVVEEIMEKIIDFETGIDIDLSPDSKKPIV